MGFFSIRRAVSKDHNAPSNSHSNSVSDNLMSPSSSTSVVLSQLFADDDSDDELQPYSAPCISPSQLSQTSPRNDRKKHSKSGKKHHLFTRSDRSSPSRTQNNDRPFSRSLAKSKARESMSRIIHRDSMKRSITGKLARSENRRQSLNIKDERSVPSPHTNTHKSVQFNNNGGSSSSSSSKAAAMKGLESKVSALTMSPVTPALAREDEHSDKISPVNTHESVTPASGALSIEAATFAMPHSGRNKSKNSPQNEGASTGSKARSRRRPPPLGSEGKATDSAADWPSGRVFPSDGGFMTGGFRITAEGLMDRPDLETHQDSDPEADEEAPGSERLVIVHALKEFRNGPTIGAGAAGRVYLAEHIPTKTTMAIKAVNVYNKEKRNQMLKELQTLCIYVSRYLVRFHGAFFDGSGSVHIALEYMDHGCLASFVKRVGALPERIVQMIAQDCLRGLRFLHHHHVLHRDFKTANILLSRKLCRAKLSDFGLARDLHPGISKVDTFVGTVAYMSPERLQGAKYTYASDIWALGVSLVECLIGRHPFNKPQNYFDYIEATAASGTLESFEGDGKRFSAQAHDFITECLYTDPKKRPQAVKLLEHPWIKGMHRNAQEFGAWLDGARAISTGASPLKH